MSANIDAVLQAAATQMRARYEESVAHADRILAAVDAYVSAAEVDIANEAAQRLGLGDAIPSERRARAHEILAIVRELPELHPEESTKGGGVEVDDDEVASNSDDRLELPLLASAARTGRALVIVGGEEDRQKLDRLERRTGFPLEWHGCEESDRILGRIRDGHVVAVVMLERLANHANGLLDAARTAGVVVEYGKKGGLASIAFALRSIEGRLCAGRLDGSGGS
jgi:hypothetical protein